MPVLEYMDARSVHDVMEARGWRPLEDDALAVVARGCIAGLAALHADRQLHRDVKPSNILLDWKWRVKLSDFGVSRAVDNTLGVAQTYVGTLAFMAPERIVGGDSVRFRFMVCGVMFCHLCSWKNTLTTSGRLLGRGESHLRRRPAAA